MWFRMSWLECGGNLVVITVIWLECSLAYGWNVIGPILYLSAEYNTSYVHFLNYSIWLFTVIIDKIKN